MLPLLVTLALHADPGHAAANPLYRELTEVGLEVGPGLRAKLPPPTLPDGLPAAEQTAVLKKLIAADYSYAEFTRPSVVAPHLLRLRDVTPSDPKAPARGADVWFVAHGDFARTADDAFLDRLLKVGRDGGEAGKTVTADDLRKRNIDPPAGDRGGYGHIGFDFLERVRLKLTGRAVWSRTNESVLAAAAVDPRFAGDREFPNQWQPLSKEGGATKAGPPSPYAGAGLYLKITKLAEPAGAMLLEQHIVFAEPTGWFDGANLLRSKLPPAVQSNVRTIRREWGKPVRSEK